MSALCQKQTLRHLQPMSAFALLTLLAKANAERDQCRRAGRRRGRDCHSVGVVGGGVAVNPVRLSANNSQRRVSSKNCSLTFGSL